MDVSEGPDSSAFGLKSDPFSSGRRISDGNTVVDLLKVPHYALQTPLQVTVRRFIPLQQVIRAHAEELGDR